MNRLQLTGQYDSGLNMHSTLKMQAAAATALGSIAQVSRLHMHRLHCSGLSHERIPETPVRRPRMSSLAWHDFKLSDAKHIYWRYAMPWVVLARLKSTGPQGL